MIYRFKNIETNEEIEVSMSMKDYTHYKGEDGNEDCWERIYEVPQISMGNTSLKNTDHWNPSSFVNNTYNTKGNYGDLHDLSSELSEKRASESDTGEDPLKRKYFDNYEKENKTKHVADKPKTIDMKNAKIEF